MKKVLLSLVAVAATVMTGWANEYAFVFDGNNDMGGLTRQTSTNPDELTFSEGMTLNEEGVEFSIRNAAETGKGFALVNAGGANAGILIHASMSSATSMTPQISLTVPNGKITEAKLYMSGIGLLTLDVDFNGKAIESENVGSLYCWKWNDKEGTESLSMEWVNNFNSRYIHKIELTYSPDLGGKQECGLSFAAKSYEAILGEDFKAPSLKNPNRLDVAWSTSDESVASVNSNGAVTLVGRGTATITAATEGNDEFAAGNAKYELTVIPSASNIAQLLEYAPSVYDRVKVNFPATVNFANGSIAFVTDADGNAACFDDIRNRNSTSTTPTTIYSVGQVIPAGWIATNATIYESVIWEGLPEKSTETVEVVYPEVNSVTPADADRVVILKNVTFDTRTAEGFTKAFGTTPDGTRYEFQDTYDVSAQPAGTYDVTCVVRYSKRGSTEYFYLAPVAYAEPSGDTPDDPKLPVYPEKLDFTLNGEKELQGVSVSQTMKTYDGSECLTIAITGESNADEITMDFETPAGWDYALIDTPTDGENTPFTTRSGDSDHWYPVKDVISMGYKKGNSFNFPVNGKENLATIYLVKEEKVWEYSIDVSFKVSKANGNDDPVEEPVYPESLKYTINGQTELEGVTVNQNMNQGSLSIDITGKTDADEVSLTFDTPEGWDGILIMAAFAEVSDIEFAKTRSEDDWYPLEYATGMGFVKGNTVTFPVDGEENWATMALYKGDLVYQTTVEVNFDVRKSEGGDEPGEDPVFPESFVVNTFNEGLDVTQGFSYGIFEINVKGEVAENTFPIVIDVPEGWDGFICYNWSHEGDVTITENNQGPKATRAEEIEWIPVEDLLAKGCVKGNRFTFEPTFNPEYNNEQTVELRLYKGDMAMSEYFNLNVAVTKGGMSAPEFPSEFDVTATGNDVTVWQGATTELPEGTLTEDENYLAVEMFHGDYAIMVSGKTEADRSTVTFNLPEGWTGVQPFKITVPNFDDYEYLRTRANESDWQMLDDVKESLGSMFGYFDTSMEGGNSFEFDANGKQVYLCYLYTDMVDADETVKLADTANPFILVVDVEKEGETPELVYPDRFDVKLSCEDLTVTQQLEDYDDMREFVITIEGECADNQLIVTLAVPEGWDGYYGQTDENYTPDIAPLKTRSVVGEDSWWMSTSEMEELGYGQGNQLTFSVDGIEHGAYMFLYKGDKVYVDCPIHIEDLVIPDGSGVDAIDSTAKARFFNLQGAEIANPEPGVYVKVINGKSYKVVVK